jgi:hypothetical protein
MGCVMIRASFPRLALAAVLSAVPSLSLAQQSQQAPAQRSRTEPQARQQTQQRSAPAAQQKPAPGASAAKPAPARAKPAAGQGKPASGVAAKPASSPAGPGGAHATLLGTFNDWKAYVAGQGRAKLCYALSEPQERLPNDLKRDPAYLFVSFRPADDVRNEIAIVMGFATKTGGPAEALVGNTRFALVTKGPNAWIENSAEQNQVVAAFTKGRTASVKATSARGNATTDNYSLTGFTQALDRARKECS